MPELEPTPAGAASSGAGESAAGPVWAARAAAVLPLLRQAGAAGREFRAWLIGCVAGETAVSLAGRLAEALDEIAPEGRPRIRLFATDVDCDAIAIARRGWYPADHAPAPGGNRPARFFERADGGYRVRREIRAMLTFAQHDPTQDPPFIRLDLVACLGDGQLEPHGQLAPLLHHCLNRDGLLFLGAGAPLADWRHLFAPLDAAAGILRRLGVADGATPAAASAFSFPLRRGRDGADRHARSGQPTLKTLTEGFVLRHFAPPAVLVDEDGNILYLTARAGRYLELPNGAASWNLHRAAPPALRPGLCNALAEALREKRRRDLPSVDVVVAGRRRRVQVAVQALPWHARPPAAALIAFNEIDESNPPANDAPSASAPDEASLALQRQLHAAHYENLQLGQQMHDLQEDLGGANEELQSINEELQVTNEDLQASSEQIQSVNAALEASLAEREQARARIEALSHRLVGVQELERRRLSGELHDRTSPNLAAMRVNLKSLAAALPPALGGELANRLADLSALLDDTTASIREICADLRPPVLDHAGLLPALESYARQFSARTGLTVAVRVRDCDGAAGRLDSERQTALFRIAQEALTNCAKHAQARRVDIELATHGAQVVLRIADDGVGFAPAALGDAQARPGLGLLTMRERAEFAGGRFRLDARPGGGTRISVEIGC